MNDIEDPSEIGMKNRREAPLFLAWVALLVLPGCIGELGIEKMEEEILPLLAAGPNLLVDLDPGSDVPVKWVLAVVRSVRRAGARRVGIGGFPLEDGEISWFRDAPGFWRSTDDGIHLPDSLIL